MIYIVKGLLNLTLLALNDKRKQIKTINDPINKA